MRNIVVLLVLVFGLPLCVFADTTPDGRPIVYCPDHVECSEAANLESCKLSDNQYDIWDVSVMYSGQNNEKGVYSFEKSSTTLAGLNSGYLNCIYKQNKNPRVINHIVVTIKGLWGSQESSINYSSLLLGPLLDVIDNEWWIIDSVPKCKSNDNRQCPMVELAGIGFDTTNLGGYRLSINGTIYQQERLSYDELLLACGATSICYVNVETTQNGSDYTLAGSVKVDVSFPDKVEIVYISTAKDSLCQFKRKTPFNLIYCEAPGKQSKLKKTKDTK